jgi:hypothetical protein
MVVPVKTLEAKQVPGSAETPPDHPDCLTNTSQPESRCNPHLKNKIPVPVLLKGCRKGRRVMT